jgi:hypothetical protein
MRTDPTPSLAAFQWLVARGDVRHYLAFTPQPETPIQSWVSHAFPSTVVDGVLVFDLGGTSVRSF